MAGFFEGISEAADNAATAMTGRTRGQREFYNSTRAGLLNSSTAPEEGSTYGGIGESLGARKRSQGYDAQSISDAVPRKGEPTTRLKDMK